MIASGFASAGANVLLTSRDEKACREAAESLQHKVASLSSLNPKPDIHYVASNASSREGCEALADYAKQIFHGKVSDLV